MAGVLLIFDWHYSRHHCANKKWYTSPSKSHRGKTGLGLVPDKLNLLISTLYMAHSYISMLICWSKWQGCVPASEIERRRALEVGVSGIERQKHGTEKNTRFLGVVGGWRSWRQEGEMAWEHGLPQQQQQAVLVLVLSPKWPSSCSTVLADGSPSLPSPSQGNSPQPSCHLQLEPPCFVPKWRQCPSS